MGRPEPTRAPLPRKNNMPAALAGVP